MSELQTFAEQLSHFGGTVYKVGGAVRDELLGLETSKDLDLEVFGVTANFLSDFLKTRFANVNEVGKSFGVFKCKMDGVDVDVSLPRKDSKVGDGHKGFDVEVDPDMSVADACRRRDFTCNAIMKNVLTGEYVDPFNGKTDLESGCLRMVDRKTFGDDPLRVLRAMQFVARFEFTVDFETQMKMDCMVRSGELDALSSERFLEEFRKLFLKSSKPSLGLWMAYEVGVFDRVFPEFRGMKETLQHPEFHPEGDCLVHTLLCVDEAAELTKGMDDDKRMTVLLATLVHDLGKPATTKVDEAGVTRALGHSDAGVPLADSFMQRLRVPLDMHAKVLKLVEKHLAPFELFAAKVKLGAVRRLARKLFPATIEELCLVASADKKGRGPTMSKDVPECEWLLEAAKDADVVHNKPLPFVSGKELMSLGFLPGPRFGELQKLADEWRDEGVDKEEVLIRLAEIE